jgi:hypothetical protein
MIYERKDNIVEFGRGHVSFRVDGAGYEGDVLVAIKKNQSAVLYDLVDIKEKNITEASNTMASDEHFQRRYDTSVTDETLPQNTENVNNKDKKYQDNT